jgi:hypothetical protein
MEIAMKRLVLTIAVSIFFAGFGTAQKEGKPTVFGNWNARVSIDPMTDEPSCVAYYKGRKEIQLSTDRMFLFVRGGVKGYRLRFDSNLAGGMNLPTQDEKSVSSIIVQGEVFESLLQSKRLRVQGISNLGSLVEEDLDLTGTRDAINFMQKKGCH